jgi:AcrR family transcriptional regulator
MTASNAAAARVVDSPGRRSAETRAKLLAAARTLFARDGYHAVRPQDIAREAGVAQGTFYQYFDDKLACFLAFTQTVGAELGEATEVAVRKANTFEEKVLASIAATYAYAREHPRELMTAMADSRVLVAEGAQSPGETLLDRWAAYWGELLRLGQEEGLVRKDLDRSLTGAAVLGVVRQSSSWGYTHGLGEAAVTEHIRRFIMAAVAPEKAEGGGAPSA